MVVSNSHFFMSNFGLSMDFDALIPPIAPNFTPGTLMGLPPHAQSLAMGGNPHSPVAGSIPISASGNSVSMMSSTNKNLGENEKNKLSGNPNKLNENNSNLNTSSLNTSSAKNNRSTLSNIKSQIEDTSISSNTIRQQQTPSPSSCTSPTNQNDLKTEKSTSSFGSQSAVTCSNDITAKLPRCIGCSQIILDQFILRVAPDLEWHATCLKCHHCRTPLDERQTCYLKDGKPFCKLDYIRLFSIRCGKCNLPFEKTDQVMRTSSKVYHVDCFSCNVCYKQLLPGDEYAIREDAIFCRDDMVELLTSGARSDSNPLCNSSPVSACMENPNSIPNMNSPQTPLSKYGNDPTIRSSSANGNPALSLVNSAHEIDRDEKIIFSPDEKSPSCKDSSRGDKRCSKDGNKPTRIRTVLNEKQLHTLRTCYNANPRPDALMREQLVEMTGLSPRVIRVWFQNKRCKDKKRSIAIKQMHQLQAEKNISGLNGVPLVAGSPMRHDPVSLDGGQFHYSPYGALGGTHNPHDLDAPYMMGFDNGPGSVLSDGLGSPGSDCSLSLSSD